MSAAHTNMNVAPTHVHHTRTRTYRLSHTTQTLCRTIAAPLPQGPIPLLPLIDPGWSHGAGCNNPAWVAWVVRPLVRYHNATRIVISFLCRPKRRCPNWLQEEDFCLKGFEYDAEWSALKRICPEAETILRMSRRFRQTKHNICVYANKE